MNEITKPPLGLTPYKFWKEHRIRDLIDAMERYSEVNKPIPKEWVAELKRHLEYE